MARFVIRGGKRLSGEYRPSGNKNGVLPMLAASVLTDDPVCLENIPLIQDVHSMLGILEDLGVAVSLRGHRVELCAKGLKKNRLNAGLCKKVRSSILFAGPLTARLGSAVLSPPGGDVIGRRRLDSHVEGLRQLGASVKSDERLTFRARKLKGADILLDEASVTATENLVMAAALARGRTTIFNAACEPHVQDLCQLLVKMGADIKGIGTNLLTVTGVSSLHGAKHRVAPDHINTAAFIAASALTGGTLCVKDTCEADMRVLARPFAKLGIGWKMTDGVLSLPRHGRLSISNDFGAAIPKLEDGTWPSFPSDLMSVAIVVATQAQGTMLFFEKLFESRMYFVDSLIEMGARIIQCDPHRVLVSGPSALSGSHMNSPDIRAGMALLVAALCAKGESVIDNAEIIDRGYETIDAKLRKLGADIKRVK